MRFYKEVVFIVTWLSAKGCVILNPLITTWVNLVVVKRFVTIAT